MLIAIRRFPPDASAAGGFTRVAISRTSVKRGEIFNGMIFISILKLASEYGEIIGIYKRHPVPFTKHHYKISGDCNAAIPAVFRYKFINDAIVFSICPYDEIRVTAGIFYHTAEIIRVDAVARDVPPKKLIFTAAIHCGVYTAEIFIPILFKNHIIADTGIYYSIRILQASLNIIAKMFTFFTIMASKYGRQGYIHHASDFSISSGNASLNAANIIRAITRNSGGEMGIQFFQGFLAIHLFSFLPI